DFERELERLAHVAVFRRRQRRQPIFMALRRDQNVAVVVRKFIQHDDRVRRLPEDQRRARIFFPRLVAEDAAGGLLLFDIGHAPRRPERLHSVPSGTGLPSTRRRSSFPTLKNGTRFAATETISPLLGLRPSRARRCFTTKLPKPRISMRSPCPMASTMASKMALTMTSESRCERWGKRLLISSIK